MKMSRTLPATLAALVALAGVARADVTVVQTAVIDNPQLKAMMQSLSPQQRAQLAQFGMGSTIQSTSYVHGQKSRTDVGNITSVIIDGVTGRMTSLNRVSHTYSTQPINAGNGGGGVKVSLKPTGKTKTILGHPCRSYHLTMISKGSNGPTTVNGDIWVAPDLPRLPVPPLGSRGPASLIAGQWSKINGMPLQTVMTIGGSPMGQTTIHTTVKSVSTRPVAASIFTIPAGYRHGPPGMMPGMPTNGPMGGPMGR